METINAEIDIPTDLDEGDVLDATDIRKIHDMYQGIKDKSIPVANNYSRITGTNEIGGEFA